MKKLILTLIWILMFCGVSHSIELSDGELFWLSQNIYWESRNQSDAAQMFVGIVTINRMVTKGWPDTIKGVVTKYRHFKWYWDGKSDIPTDKTAWIKARTIARETVKRYDTLKPKFKNVYWFHDISEYPWWADEYTFFLQFDDLLFYTDK